MDLRGACGTPTTPTSWDKDLIVRLIEIAHGQWMYQNVHMHDTATGFHATRRKEELQNEIEDQIQMGGEGLVEDDKYLLNINLEDMETTSGEKKNTGSFPYKLHKRKGYNSIVKEMHHQMERLNN